MKNALRLLAIVLFVAGCTDSVDKAAKKRIFSPEDPPQAIAAASEKLAPEDVADNARVARRILGMSAAEAIERIGAHTFTASVTFEWLNGDRNVKLNESRTLVSGAGGVSGDFHGTLENSRDQGFEVMRVGTAVFAKNRYGKFRERKRDRGMAERAREQLHGVIAEFDSLFKGRMKLQPQGTATYDGRTVWKYVASLGPEMPKNDKALPPPPAAKNGGDEDTQLRQQFFEKSVPKSISGEVLVDAEKSVVLKARLDGTMTAPSDAGTDAVLRMTVDAAVTKIGVDPNLKAPPDFLKDEDKPKGIADALERFGIVKKADGGTSAGEPAEDEDEAK
ncbi:MAG: hypothetical protein ACJ790_18270 [Myxococcaceae bacterium]